jgi:serine phosphatase RsbU (regulator of sigma subunit)/anti-sigma regulatory factor (Ser/Thr protein kinase)
VGDVIVEQGVRALEASAGLLSILNEDGTTLVVVRDVGFPQDVVRHWRRIPMSTPIPITDAVKTGQAVWFDSKGALVERYPHLTELSAMPHDGARAAVPLVLGERVLGVLVFVFPHQRDFPEEDGAFLRSLAQLCAQAIDRARLYEHEHRVAGTLQRAFLPAGLPDLPGVAINAAYVPGVSESEIGGDWYDVFRLPDGRVALCVGDVVGRGLQAAVIMGQLRQSIRAAALEFHSPLMVLERAGRVLHLTYEAEGMATAIFGIFDPVLLTFTYSAAGHPAPVLVSPDGQVEVLACGGLPLGVETPNIPSAWTVPVPRGSLLVLYTDGLIESTRNVIEGEQALIAAARAEADDRSPDPASAILARMIPGGDPPDDVAILTIGVSTAARTRVDLTVRATPAAGRVVRQALRRFLAENDVEAAVASNLEVALGEALSNAIEHAYGAVPGMVDVGAWREATRLVVEVRDHGRWRPERQEDRGHGLQLMRGLVDSVDLEVTASGTTVRLSQGLSVNAPGA